jgi:hypothetical protein
MLKQTVLIKKSAEVVELLELFLVELADLLALWREYIDQQVVLDGVFAPDRVLQAPRLAVL